MKTTPPLPRAPAPRSPLAAHRSPLPHRAALALAPLLLFAPFPAQGAGLIVDTDFNINRTIPDGDSSGLVDRRVVSALPGASGTVRVNLNIAPGADGGFNGDLYVTLSHGDNFAVLINRPGRDTDNIFGYDDGGINVTLGDAATGDIHSYRDLATGSPDLALSGSLSGDWQPDGRRTDPDSVSGLSARTTSLASFQTASPAGEWVLFVSDLSPGGQSLLVSWGLEVVAVPEPIPPAPLLALLAATAAWTSRHRRQRAS